MKKIFIVMTLVSTFSIASQADYFNCELSQMGSVLASQEAEYRVLNASASADGFTCEGRINSIGQTEVKLTELDQNRIATATENGSRATTSLSTLPKHNEYNMICSCGMN